jgi:hypothetical protein
MKIRKKTLTCGARLSAATPPHAVCRVGQHCPLRARRYKAPRFERQPCPKPRCLSQSTTSPPFLDEHHAAAVLPPLAQLATHLLLFPRKSTVSRATWFFIGEEPRHLPSSSLLGDPRAAAAVVVPNAYRTRLTLIPFRVQVIVVGIIEPPVWAAKPQASVVIYPQVPVRPPCFFLRRSSSDHPRCRGVLPLHEPSSAATEVKLHHRAAYAHALSPPSVREHACVTAPHARPSGAAWPPGSVGLRGHGPLARRQQAMPDSVSWVVLLLCSWAVEDSAHYGLCQVQSKWW